MGSCFLLCETAAGIICSRNFYITPGDKKIFIRKFVKVPPFSIFKESTIVHKHLSNHWHIQSWILLEYWSGRRYYVLLKYASSLIQYVYGSGAQWTWKKQEHVFWDLTHLLWLVPNKSDFILNHIPTRWAKTLTAYDICPRGRLTSSVLTFNEITQSLNHWAHWAANRRRRSYCWSVTGIFH